MSAGKQFVKLFETEMKRIFREKQVWFWNLFFPIILMVLFMLIFGDQSSSDFKAKIALVKPVSNSAADMLETQLHHVPVFEWKSEQPVSAEQADAWIKAKDVDAVIQLPQTNDAKTLKLIVNTENEKNVTSQAVAGILDKLVQQANLAAAGVTEPAFKLESGSVNSGAKDLSYVDFLLTGMIALSVAQGGLFGMVGPVEMRRSGLLKRLRMTPMRMSLFGLASMLVRFLLGMIQIIILTLIGVLGFGAHVHIGFITLLIAFFIGSLAFNALGYFFSSFSKSLEAYMGMANIASFLMMFLSGVFFATNTLPEWLHPVAKALPLTYFVNGVRDGLVYGGALGSSDFWLGLGVLAVWGAVTFAIGAALYRRGKVAVR